MIMIAQDVTEKNNRSNRTNLTIGPACMTMPSISNSVEFIKSSVVHKIILKKIFSTQSSETLFLNFFNYLNQIFVSRNLLDRHGAADFYVDFGTSCKYT
jgi:hypothetical protein